MLVEQASVLAALKVVRDPDLQRDIVSLGFIKELSIDGGRVAFTIELTTPEGARRFPIAGIFYDYSRDQGIVYMSARNFVQFWHDDRVNSVAVYLKENGSGEELTRAFREQFSQRGQFLIYSNRSLRTRVFEIFDQTFAVTGFPDVKLPSARSTWLNSVFTEMM
jgi:putative ABC transport system permease protein